MTCSGVTSGRLAFREGEDLPSFDAEWRPSHIVDVKGVLQPFETYIGAALLTRRLRQKGPALRAGGGIQVEAAAGEDGRGLVRPIVMRAPLSHG